MAKRSNGEGSIYQRGDGRWVGVVTVGYENGRRQRRYHYGASQREVREQLTRSRHEVQQGLPMRTNERLTVGAYLDSWLQSARSEVRPMTWISYEGHVRLHIAPTLGRVPLAKLTPPDLRALYADRTAAGLSPGSVTRVHATLRRALGQAYRDGLVPRNVGTLVSPPVSRRAEIRPLAPEQARTLLAAARGDRLEALYAVAVALGLRQGEALGLRWQDVDLDTGTLTVRRSLQRIPKPLRGPDDGGYGEHYRLVEPKTSRSRRTLTMPAIVMAALRDHRVRQRKEQLAAGPAWQGERWGLVFATTIGTPLDARNVSHRFEALLVRAGLPRVRFHDLRHSAATLMLAQGVSPRVIMETLGHSQIAMTMNLYAHVMPTMQRDAADRMDALLGTEVVG